MDIATDGATRALLQRFGFDEKNFDRLVERVRSGTASAAANRLSADVEAPRSEDVIAMPARGTETHRAFALRGREALRRGEVGVILLAGGMATRFGGVVKAAAMALPERSFFSLKVADVRAAAHRADARIPMFLMTSFATNEIVTAMAQETSTLEVPIETFQQSTSIRLLPDGAPYRDATGHLSLYAPGHGDLTDALRRGGLLDRFRKAGGKSLVMSNVDNVAATLDEAILGAHLASGRTVTCEVTSKEKGEKGGAPARVGGALQIVESFRFPENFDQDAIPVFNTNTFVFDAAAIDRDFDLTWFAVRKNVDGNEVIQFERLVGELTALLPTQYLQVPRYGVEGRFQPAKDPEELERRRPEIAALLHARGVLP